MVAIDIKHSLDPVHVTTAHPFYAIQGVPMEQANSRTMKWLSQRQNPNGLGRGKPTKAGRLCRASHSERSEGRP